MNSAQIIAFVVCFVGFFCLAKQMPGQLYNQPTGYDIDDLVCGPRCVQYVLSHYCMERELTELIREVQSPDVTQGSSLASLQRCLVDRGIYAVAIRLPQGKVIDWPYPAIMLRDIPAEGIGHFVVWLPTSTRSRADVWRGTEGFRSYDARRFFSQQSQIVLLTAPDPIQAPIKALDSSVNLTPIMANSVVGVFGIGLLLVLLRWTVRGPFLTLRVLKGVKQWERKRSLSLR